MTGWDTYWAAQQADIEYRATTELLRLEDPAGWRPVQLDLGEQQGRKLKFIGVLKDLGDGTLQARGIFKVEPPPSDA